MCDCDSCCDCNCCVPFPSDLKAFQIVHGAMEAMLANVDVADWVNVLSPCCDWDAHCGETDCVTRNESGIVRECENV